jgi:hypothetical protein
MIKSMRIVFVNNIIRKSILTDKVTQQTSKNMHKSLVGLINCKKFLLALIFAFLNFA